MSRLLALLPMYGGTWSLVELDPGIPAWRRTNRHLAAGSLWACEAANRLQGKPSEVDDAMRMQAKRAPGWDANGAPIEEPMQEYTAEERAEAQTAYNIFRATKVIGENWKGVDWSILTPEWQGRWLEATRELLRARRGA